jgi:hypothetical protein
MAHLRARLDRDIAPMGLFLIINILVLERERRLFGGLSNVTFNAKTRKLTVQKSFGYSMQELDRPFMFANGSGAAQALANRQLHQIQDQLRVKPRNSADHMNLLAVVNRRVAAKDQAVSPFCHVTFLSGEEGKGAESRVFVEGGESVLFEMPTILSGLDLSGMARRTYEQFERMKRGEATEAGNDAGFDEEDLKRRP